MCGAAIQGLFYEGGYAIWAFLNVKEIDFGRRDFGFCSINSDFDCGVLASAERAFSS